MTGKRKRTNSTSAACPSSHDSICKPFELSVESGGSGGGTSNDRILADRQHLLNIFPAEVWLLITEQLDDDHRERLSNSSLFLRQLLLPQRVQFMFQNVWGILGSSRYEELFDDGDGDGMYDVSLPRLRLVCHSWNNVFDRFCQLHPARFLETTEDSIVGDSFWVRMSNQIEGGVMSIYQDLSYLSTARNPFFARSVAISTPRRMGDENLWSKKLGVLSTHGHQIWHFAFDLIHEHIEVNINADPQPLLSPAAVYLNIRSTLERVPNLKTLRVDLEHLEEITTDQLTELRNEITSGPLPRLEHLEVLQTTNVPSLVFQELIRQNSHVSTFEIIRQPHHEDYDICNAPLPNLSKLFISFEGEEDFLRLTNPQVNWSLTKLSLFLYRGNDFNWQTIFNVLHDKFRSTLTHLNLFLPKNILATRILQMDLPNLTHLKMDDANILCLDFLLPMRHSLKDLRIATEMSEEITLAMAEQEEETSVIKFFSCVKSGLKSNIWQVLSKLEYLNLDIMFDSELLLELEGSKLQPNNDTILTRDMRVGMFYPLP